MAELSESPFSLMSLEDELTCSICLSTFDCPVTIPCGHNFCQDCLLATWKDSYSCPQCRTHFSTKPELKKNTVLSTVVETFVLRTNRSEAGLVVEESKAEEKDVLRCDTCMEAEASKTCLTCMASFCDEHLRPHQENPIFRLHQLSEPVGDLSERICPDHHKLMELFCSQHGRPICSLCLQQVHKGCTFVSPEEQRNLIESDLRGKLDLLDAKITKNETVISQMGNMQNKLRDAATNRKKTLTAEYQQMRDILAQEERVALNTVDRELESGETKLKGLVKKFTENIDSMGKAKEEIQSLLSQSQTLAFLQASYNLPKNVNFDPYTPQVTLDSKKVTATQTSTAALKEYLTEILKQPVEARLAMLKPDAKPVPGSAPANSGSTGSQPESDVTKPPKQKKPPRSHSPGRPPIQPLFQQAPSYIRPPAGFFPPQHPPGPRFMGRPNAHVNTGIFGAYGGFTPFNPGIYQSSEQQWTGPVPQPKAAPKKKQKQKPPQTTDDKTEQKNKARSMENLLDLDGKDKPRKTNPQTPADQSKEIPETSDIPPNITSAEKRSELLKYGTVLTLDPKTAHKRIALSEEFTKASVSDEHTNYPDCPERFAVCSQVLATKGFSRGRHYWEVRLSSNNFIGVGLAYSSIDRKGPTSRLGRNVHSWCVEWFNVKLSAWYNSSETVLVNPNPKRVGVLLDCEEGTATFYNVADRAYPFHSFVFPFAEAVYPAFWIFSSGSSITLCKLQA
uniref:E3 ubiquitin/ISG15 ligase TRIM25 isoform X1 n=1 Tax=Epinephelus lanceolatus TaxID=310571 RepID=UPI0014467012|nr:E3 ubiquitin/ISG15 ligase TRIM25 isoform X1 [Epinephelus lanceolatus]XP_033480055.1 E3 ubiquitin/ISG15 ligase TRIM25 isoform X1 [Epinephelus lanceolatus]